MSVAASRPVQGGHLAFGEALPWGKSWTDPLIKAGRFHKVTDPKMRKAGALYYSWLGENEKVGNEAEDDQSRVICPNVGGFVYLFSPTGEDIDCPPSDDMPAVYFEAGGDQDSVDRELIMGMPSSVWRSQPVAPLKDRGWFHCCCISRPL